MLYVPLDFENNLTVDVWLDSRAYISAIAQNVLDRIQQKASNNLLKIDDPTNFQIQVANGQLDKPLATTTLEFETGDKIVVGNIVVMKKLTAINMIAFYEEQQCSH